MHHLLYSFPGEHARSSFFKHIGQGVTQLHVDGAARLFSCGADGSMKVRQLPERELTVHSLYQVNCLTKRFESAKIVFVILL